MKRNLELYIAGQRADLADDALILSTYALTDLTNPTAVKNSYTQTITLPGTPNNNAIFTDAFRLDRRVAVGYNPLRKVDFTIYSDTGEILESGYVKLEGVTKNGSTVEYSVTLYGGLGSFLYGLSYDESGNKRTLADLDWLDNGNPLTEFDFTMNGDAVVQAWDEITSSSVVFAKWHAVNFAPCYNGLPDNFDADKMLIYQSDVPFTGMDLPESITEGSDTAYPHNGYILATLGREYTEDEVREFRSYLQRPVFSIKALFTALGRSQNNGGYTLDLDSSFFNNNNPYYADAWCTLPLLSESPALRETTQSKTPTIAATALSGSGSVQVTIDAVPPSQQVQAVLNVKVNYATDDATMTGGLTTSVSRDTPGVSGHTDSKRVLTMLQLVAYDSNDTIISAGDAVCVGSPLWGVAETAAKAGYTPVGNGGLVSTPIAQTLTNTSAGRYSGSATAQLFCESYGASYYKILATPIQCLREWHRAGRSTYRHENATIETRFTALASYTSVKDCSVTLADAGGSFIQYTSGTAIRTGCKVTKAILLTTEKTPAEYLLSYCKTFGLVISKDKDSKTIRIRQRGTFYDGQIIDLDRRIDRSAEIAIDPAFADARWLRFTAEIAGGLADQYADLYGETYGSQKINTGYEFNADVTDLLEDYAFRGAVQARLESEDYCVCKESGNYTFPSWQTEGYTLQYYKNNGAGEALTKDFDGKTPASRTWYGSKDRCDTFPRPQFCDNESKPVDGNDVLLFLTGFHPTPQNSGYYVTDDFAEMYNQNGGKPCWLMRYPGGSTTEISRPIAIPFFSRFDTNGVRIHETMEFGLPRAIFDAITCDTSTASSVYDAYWRDYLSDRYGADTVCVTCKVDLRGLSVDGDLLRHFYWFDNTLWVLNKIDQYSRTTYDLTTCEFVKVNNKSAYTQSNG